MTQKIFTCPRCFHTSPMKPGVRFCPRCGLEDATETANTAPLDVKANGRVFRVLDRLAIGSVCNVYRCRFEVQSRPVEGVFKIARDPRTNHLVSNEAQILRRLYEADPPRRYTPFFPDVEETFGFFDEPRTPPRHANVLRLHEAIQSLEELHTLEEVKLHYPTGLDPRDVAWIWRRLLSVLGFVHAQNVVHAAVLPMHILIEPREHKLVLIDWCCAVSAWRENRMATAIVGAAFQPWYKRQGALRHPPAPGLDIALGARSMIELLGGDPVEAKFPANVEPALVRYFQRCLAGGADSAPEAWKLLDDFDKLIESLWGPRTFRPLPLPLKAKPAIS